MKFCEFKTGDQAGDRVLINPSRIQRITPHQGQSTLIAFDSDDGVVVKESIDDVLRKLSDRNDRG
jgi:uncharacterized protein YlzI (FlbEa/FlbD family)